LSETIVMSQEGILR